MAEYQGRLQVEGPAAEGGPDPPEALLIEPAPGHTLGGWRSASGLLTSPGESAVEVGLHTPVSRGKHEKSLATPPGGGSTTPGTSAFLAAALADLAD